MALLSDVLRTTSHGCAAASALHWSYGFFESYLGRTAHFYQLWLYILVQIDIFKKYLHSHFHFRIIHNSQDVEATSVFLSRWMDKDESVHAQWNIRQPLSRPRLSFKSARMKLEHTLLSEMSQTWKTTWSRFHEECGKSVS